MTWPFLSPSVPDRRRRRRRSVPLRRDLGDRLGDQPLVVAGADLAAEDARGELGGQRRRQRAEVPGGLGRGGRAPARGAAGPPAAPLPGLLRALAADRRAAARP